MLGNVHDGFFSLKYEFGFILPALPLPTVSPKGFQSLVEELNIFKIVPSNINVETPSNNLGDLVLSIKLSNRVLLRLTYGSFELILVDFQFSDFDSGVIDKALSALCNCFNSMSIKFDLGTAKLTWNGHLFFDTSVADTYLYRNSIVDANSSISFSPRGILYKLNLPDSQAATIPVLGISESMFHANALFIDFSVSYPIQGEPSGSVKRFSKDLNSVMRSIMSVSPTSSSE